MTRPWFETLAKDAALSGDHRLWVPMRMEAMAFPGDGKASFMDLTPNYSALNDKEEAPLGLKLRPDLARTSTTPQRGMAKAKATGVHLHWELPAGFGHLRLVATDGDGPQPDSVAPLVPNRWLVTRLWSTATGPLQQKSWLVESDYLSRTEGSASWLASDGVRCEVTRLGRTRELEKAGSPMAASAGLTAFAPGNLAFAAFYPSCRGVFGFQDDAIQAVPDGTPCTYLVAGWFSDPKAEPLAAVTVADWIKRMRKLDWAVGPDTKLLPTGVVCYGALRLVWPTMTATPRNLQARSVDVALGSSTLDAIAAMSKDTGAAEFPAQAARLRNELQFAALSRRRPVDPQRPDFLSTALSELSSFSALRARHHERGFATHPGGTAWEIVRTNGKDAKESSSAQPLVRLTDSLSRGLAMVNARQRALDEAARRTAGARRRLHAAWYQRQFQTTRQGLRPDERATLAGALQPLLDAAFSTVERLAAEEALLQRRFTRAKMLLDRSVARRLRDHATVPRAMPRFRRANDPFVLVRDLTICEIQGGQSPLLCRVSNQAVDSIRIDNPPDGARARVDRAMLRTEAAARSLLPPATVLQDAPELVLDVLFADPIAAPLLARLAFSYANPDRGDIKRVENAIRAAQDAIQEAAGTVTEGRPKTQGLVLDCGSGLVSFLSALNQATAAANPVFMVWEVMWLTQPSSGDDEVDAQRLLQTWSFDAERGDYVCSDANVSTFTKPVTYSGFTVLARHLDRGFALTRSKFPLHAFVFERLQELTGQSLAGLNEALGMLDTGPQVVPLQGPGRLDVDTRIKEKVLNAYTIAPLLSTSGTDFPFLPLRGALLSLSRLWLVDTFGRVRRLVDGGVVVGTNKPIVMSSALSTARAGYGQLPPRFVQPSRLLFRWVSARSDGQESQGDLQTSPICGWIIHNRVDRSLLVYDGDGKMLGAVQAIPQSARQEEIRWSKLPLRVQPADWRPGEADIPNPHLQGFVTGLLKGTVRRGTLQEVRDLLDAVENASPRAGAAGLQSALFGRPIALVRATLRLELDGPPLSDQGAALRAESAPMAWPAYTRIRFPLRLGDSRIGGDGLVGYFVDDGSATAYARLRLAADQTPGTAQGPHVYFDYGSTLDVACARPGDPAIRLTLLMEPMQGTHIVSGILPVNRVTLPSSLVSASLADLELPFLVAPILGERDPDPKAAAGPAMPLPTGGHEEWNWLSYPDDKSPPREVPAQSDSQPASTLDTPKALYEGWLKYRPAKGSKRS